MAGIGLHGQHAPHSTRTLLDGDRTQPQTIKLIPSETAREAKTLAVVIHYQNKPAVVLRQFYHDMGSLRMLFYVVECFTVNLENLAADAVRSVQFHRIDKHIQCERGFVAVAFGK